MKVLLVVPDTDMGGVTTAAVNLTNELSRRGNDVYFLDMSNAVRCRERFDEKIRILSLDSRSSFWNISKASTANRQGMKRIGLLLLGAVKKLTVKSGLWYHLVFSKFKECGEFDVAIAFRQGLPCYTFVLNKVSAKKKIGFVHGELELMGYKLAWEKCMPHFDKVAYVSDAVKTQFISAFPHLRSNACTVYNMFDIEKLREDAKREPSFVMDDACVNIVTVSRIYNYFKMTQRIVEICERLKNQTKKPFHWYVVGDGPDFEDTVALARERGVEDVLTYVGAQSNPHTIVSRSDFTVLTSRSEAYPMVVIESFILEKPIVVAKFGSAFEMIQQEQNGLVAEQSVDSLTACVLDMIEDRNGVRSCCVDYLQQHVISNDRAYAQFIDAVEGECE
ncbi:MAG: glycosyltransferase [Clostridia bacterium]|nr:glycosyltransferase [Clostridia bacterium]